MPKQAVKKTVKKKNGYQMPDPIPLGEVLQDIAKKKWIIGQSIGVGGFGEIYCAAEYKDSKKPTSYPYVVKIEPHGNGPLFVEMHFYMRNAKQDDINAWKVSKKLKSLGMPAFIGSGSHECNGTKYRFVVMERFGRDIWSIFLENGKKFPGSTVFSLGLQMLNVLEYIHSRGYVHADVKGANILLGNAANSRNQAYLVDFGLAAHYSTKEFKVDPKKAHNGTIEYTSRDAHSGVPTRRGDLEILAYNLLHWLGITLPWEKCLTDPVSVQNSKNKFMDGLPKTLNDCFGKNQAPDALTKLFTYILKLKHDQEPDYNKCSTIIKSGLEFYGESSNGILQFSSPTKRKTGKGDVGSPDKKRKIGKGKAEEEPETSSKKATKSRKVNNENSPVKKSRGKAKVDLDNPTESDDDIVGVNGYTAEMLRVMRKMEKKKPIETKKEEPVKRVKSKKASLPMIVDSDEDIIEGTPPSPPRRTVRLKKPTRYIEENSD